MHVNTEVHMHSFCAYITMTQQIHPFANTFNFRYQWTASKSLFMYVRIYICMYKRTSSVPDTNKDVFSCRKTDVFSCRKTNVFSCRKTNVFSCRKTNVFSCRKTNVFSCRKTNVFSCRKTDVFLNQLTKAQWDWYLRAHCSCTIFWWIHTRMRPTFNMLYEGYPSMNLTLPRTFFFYVHLCKTAHKKSSAQEHKV